MSRHEGQIIVELFNKVKPPYNINQLTQEQALRALRNEQQKEEWIQKILGQRAVLQQFLAGLVLIVANRLFDGLDGAVARVNGSTDLGGYLDIVADFAFYVSIPLAFGLANPASTLPALVLVASFVLTGTSFLAYAVIAANRGEETEAHGKKSFFYSTGLAEGGETIAVFIAMALLPTWFGVLAWAYAALCLLTVVQRSLMAVSRFTR